MTKIDEILDDLPEVYNMTKIDAAELRCRIEQYGRECVEAASKGWQPIAVDNLKKCAKARGK